MASVQQYQGHRLKGNLSPEIYLVLDNKLRWIPDPETYNNIFYEPWKFDTIEQYVIDEMPKGIPLLNDSVLIKSNNSPKIYLTDINNNNKCKRWITNPDSFNKYGFDWNKVKTVSNIIIDNFIDGPEII